MSTLEFAGAEWRAALRAALTELLTAAAADLDPRASFSLCEVFTDAPGGGERVWAVRITGAQAEFFDHAIPADFSVRGDWAAVRPIAKVVYEGATEAELAGLATHREAMAGAGRLHSEGDLRRASRPLRRVLSAMHDRLARQTA